jgi:hypothetical protein
MQTLSNCEVLPVNYSSRDTVPLKGQCHDNFFEGFKSYLNLNFECDTVGNTEYLGIEMK